MSNEFDNERDRDILRGLLESYGTDGVLEEMALWLEEVDEGACAHMSKPIRALLIGGK